MYSEIRVTKGNGVLEGVDDFLGVWLPTGDGSELEAETGDELILFLATCGESTDDLVLRYRLLHPFTLHFVFAPCHIKDFFVFIILQSKPLDHCTCQTILIKDDPLLRV